MNARTRRGRATCPSFSVYRSLRKEVHLSHARPLPPLPPTIFDRAVDKVVVSFKDWRFNRAKAALEHELARIVETANGHQAKHLPTGAARVRGAVSASQSQDRCVLHQTPCGSSLDRTRRAGAPGTGAVDPSASARSGSSQGPWHGRRHGVRGHPARLCEWSGLRWLPLDGEPVGALSLEDG